MTMPTTTRTETIELDATTVDVTVSDQGAGRTFLLLHGGAGPQSVATFADLLASTHAARVVVPVHPGFNGTQRPSQLDSVPDLARLYSALVDSLELRDLTVIGNSIGGWIAAELALLANPRVSSVVLVNAVGLELPADPIADFFSLTMDQVAELAYYRPDKFRIDVDGLPEAVRAIMGSNRAALLAYAGASMSDPTLADRLGMITTPTLVAWGTADRMVPLAHAQTFADAIPKARLALLETAGHLPQLETPDQLAELVWRFASEGATTADTTSVAGE